MLAQHFPLPQLRTMLVPRAEWQPYPTIHERAPWQTLPLALRQCYLTRAEALVGAAWPSLPATLFLEFARNGNRRNYEIPHFERRGMLGTLVTSE